MPLIRRNTVPPGGWVYEQKYNGGIKKFSSMGPMEDAAKDILNFRKGNGLDRATLDEVLDDLDEFTCNRLGQDPRWVSKKKLAMFSSLSHSPQHLLQGVVRAAESVSRVLGGTRVLREWFGDGAKPVARDLAEARAAVCLSCPKNQESHGLMHLTSDVAKAITEQLEQKHSMNLSVPNESDLHTCAVCRCHIPLKVWVPIETIAHHTPFIDEFPAPCWIPAESAKLQPTPA